MNIVIIDGYLGAGKTLAMTILAQFFKELSGCATYSNYGVNGAFPFSHYKDFLHVAVQSSSIIMLDEAHSDLDSRNFNTNAVKFFTHLVFYFRKLRTTMFLATPSIENLDSRVRSICNLYCHVTKTKDHFIYELYDMQSMRYLKRYKIARESAYLLASQLYDTYNMVLPVEFPSERNEFNSFVKELKYTSESYYKNLSEAEFGEAVRTPSETGETNDNSKILLSV
jgi:hypothetical protein